MSFRVNFYVNCKSMLFVDKTNTITYAVQCTQLKPAPILAREERSNEYLLLGHQLETRFPLVYKAG